MVIELISLEQLREAYYLARDIYTVDGRILLLRRGSKLDSEYRDRLIQLGFHSVFVSDDITDDIHPTEIVRPTLRFQANSMVFEILNRQELIKNRQKIAELRILIRDIVAEILGLGEGITVDFPEIKTFANYVYLHSVNVAVLGILIGRELGLDEEALEDYALGALLHDIGKVEIPDRILEKEGPLTDGEFSIVKKHSRRGFELLNSRSTVKPRAYTIALQHHEAFDGSGYPSGRGGKEIHVFSRIATVVDIFDALTSDRPYKRRWSFYNTLSHMETGIRNKLDPKVLDLFVRLVPPFPLGSTVRLSTGEVGIVSKNNPQHLDRPTVRIVCDSSGQEIPRELLYEINLAENLGTGIVYTFQHKPV